MTLGSETLTNANSITATYHLINMFTSGLCPVNVLVLEYRPPTTVWNTDYVSDFGVGFPWWRRFRGLKASVQVRPWTFAFLNSLVVKALTPCCRGRQFEFPLTIVRISCTVFKLIYLLVPLHCIALVCSSISLQCVFFLLCNCSVSIKTIFTICQLHHCHFRKQPITKMKLNYGLLPKRSDPLPPQTFGTFGTLFRRLIFFWNVWGNFFLAYFTKIRVKSVQKFLDLIHPPPFSAQNSKIVGAQKASQYFWIASDPPPPYGRSP